MATAELTPPRRRRWLRRVLIAFGVLSVVVAVLAGLSWWQLRSIVGELHAGPKGAIVSAANHELRRAPTRTIVHATPTAGAQTILLIGSDRRWNDPSGGRSDTVILMRIDPARHRIALLSIPRDLRVTIPGHGVDRINAAFETGGERLLIRTVRETFGVRIDHFVEVNFRGFEDIVRQIGGVYIPVDQRYYNRNLHTVATDYANIDLRPGYQRLSPADALAFVRYRHTDSDFYRAARQQLFLREAVRQVLAEKYDVLRMRRLVRSFADATASDISSIGEIWSIVSAFRDTPAGSIVRLTVPARNVVVNGADELAASAADRREALREWYGLPRGGSRAAAGTSRHAAVGTKVSSYRKPPLRPDGGAGRRLVAAWRGVARCAPTALPPGFWWPTGAARRYTVAGQPAVAAYATAGSGDSILWMWTTWQHPPILTSPSAELRVHGRVLDVYRDGNKIRQVAWSEGPVRAWVTNTLRDQVSNARMLALAETCR